MRLYAGTADISPLFAGHQPHVNLSLTDWAALVGDRDFLDPVKFLLPGSFGGFAFLL
jgi:hypothetical protein